MEDSREKLSEIQNVLEDSHNDLPAYFDIRDEEDSLCNFREIDSDQEDSREYLSSLNISDQEESQDNLGALNNDLKDTQDQLTSEDVTEDPQQDQRATDGVSENSPDNFLATDISTESSQIILSGIHHVQANTVTEDLEDNLPAANITSEIGDGEEAYLTHEGRKIFKSKLDKGPLAHGRVLKDGEGRFLITKVFDANVGYFKDFDKDVHISGTWLIWKITKTIRAKRTRQKTVFREGDVVNIFHTDTNLGFGTVQSITSDGTATVKIKHTYKSNLQLFSLSMDENMEIEWNSKFLELKTDLPLKKKSKVKTKE